MKRGLLRRCSSPVWEGEWDDRERERKREWDKRVCERGEVGRWGENNVASQAPSLGVQAKPPFALPRRWALWKRSNRWYSLGMCGGCFDARVGQEKEWAQKTNQHAFSSAGPGSDFCKQPIAPIGIADLAGSPDRQLDTGSRFEGSRGVCVWYSLHTGLLGKYVF
jgi:hypothetical protein